MKSPLQQVEELFHRALELPTGERAAYLDGACGGRAELRPRVEALLAAHEEAGKFLPTDAGGAPALPPTPDPHEVGTRIGRYKLLQRIGEGGCGTVFMAEQMEPVRRRVALKIIKLGMDTKSVVARFEAERQALALMDHPHIAQVFDAGATDAGRPFFVMELVRGIPITRYCDENHLGTAERLKLFIAVCQAVQHAHQKGIIHRDLKPSNILVTVNDGGPVPKVIDFGIAKATNQQPLTDKTLFTAFEQFIGTPAYMSPEQAMMTSVDIDTRSDIYSLGVLLYELLTGVTPFDATELMAAGLDEMRRVIRETEPMKPSTRLTRSSGSTPQAALATRHLSLATDLDWIVMKCLEKDRARRYETANGLASDIQRHLHNEAVLARPPRAAYRFQKLVRRNKLAFAAAAVIAAVLVIGVIVSAGQAVRATRAKREAVEQHKLADMQLALQAWEEGDPWRAIDLIAASHPAPGQAPAFEWRYLTNLCRDQSIRTFGDSNQPFRSALFLDRDSLLLNDEKTITLHDVSGRDDQLLLEDQDGISRPTFCSGNTNLLATVTDDSRIKVWDLAARRVLVVFEGHPRSSIVGLTFSPDGKLLASAGGELSNKTDNSVKLWDVEAKNPQPLRTLYHYSYGAKGVLFSPDGRRLFSSGTESMIRVWDVATGAEAEAPLKGYAAWGGPLVRSPDGLWMASGNGDSTISVWNLSSHKLERTLIGSSAPVQSLTFSPDGRTLATGGRDYTIRLWDFTTGRQLSLLRGHRAAVNWLSFSPDGRRLVSQSEDGLVKLWQTTPGLDGNILTGNPVWQQGVALSPDARHLASVASGGSAVQLWNLATGSLTFLNGHSSEEVMCAVFSPDGRMLATGSHDRTVRLWDVGDHSAVAVLNNEFPVGSLAFSPDGRTLIVGGSSFFFLEGDRDQGGLQFWDLPSRQATGTVSGDVTNIVKLALSVNGASLATGHKDGAVSLWDVQTRRLLYRFESQFKTHVMSLAFSPTEPVLAASDVDGNIVLYNTMTLEALRPPLKAHTWVVSSLAFSPDGRTLASAGEGGGLKLWNVASRQVALTLNGHAGTVTGVAFSRDGKFLASCGADATVRLWHAATPAGADMATKTKKRGQ